MEREEGVSWDRLRVEVVIAVECAAREVPREFGKVRKSVFSHLAVLELGPKTEASLDRHR